MRISKARPPIRQSLTQIPDRPNISDFLNQWYDWHRGFKVITREDGSEERQSLLGQRLDQTPVGHLPHSLGDLTMDHPVAAPRTSPGRRRQGRRILEQRAASLAATRASRSAHITTHSSLQRNHSQSIPEASDRSTGANEAQTVDNPSRVCTTIFSLL